MARKSSGEIVLPEEPMTAEEWLAQEPCPECGGRPNWNPTTGVHLKHGHSALCSRAP